MAKLLLKKSYRHKDLQQVGFNDLWNHYGVFTTMRIVGKPPKILFFKDIVTIYTIFEQEEVSKYSPMTVL